MAIVPLTEDVNAKAAASALAASLDVSVDDMPEQGIWKIKCVLYSLACNPISF